MRFLEYTKFNILLKSYTNYFNIVEVKDFEIELQGNTPKEQIRSAYNQIKEEFVKLDARWVVLVLLII